MSDNRLRSGDSSALCRSVADHTHSACCETGTVEFPVRVKQALSLDEAPSWVIVSEQNVDEWPNGGLSPLPRQPATFSHGFIPPDLFAQIKSSFLKLARARRSHTKRR